MFLLLLLGAGLSAIAIPAKAVEPPQWIFREGDQLGYRLTQDAEMQLDLGTAGELSTHIVQTVDFRWEVELEENGTAGIAQHIDRVQLTIDAPDRVEMQFDSQQADTPSGYGAMLAPLVKVLLATPVKMVVTPSGKVEDIEIPARIVEAYNTSPGGKLLGELATPEGLEQCMRRNVFQLPEVEQLEVGYEWSNTVRQQNPQVGAMMLTTTYRYQDAEQRDEAVVEVFDVSQELMVQAPQEETAEATMEIREQSSSGQVRFNRTAGRLEQFSTSLQTTAEIRLEENTTTQTMHLQTKFEWQPPVEESNE